jgi:HSP20 family protein
MMPGALTRWDPLAGLSEVRTRLDRMFDDSPWLSGRERAWIPAIDVVRENGKLIVRADAPGIKPEEVKIEVQDDILTISGEYEQHTEEQHKRYVRHERRCGSFSRSMALPAGVDANKITASTHDGVVEVTIPLPKEARKEKIAITPTAG